MIPWYWLILTPFITIIVVVLVTGLFFLYMDLTASKIPLEEASKENAEAIDDELRD